MSGLERVAVGAAVVVLLVTGGAAGLATASVLVGWQPRTVMSTSMVPALHPGDLVLTSRPASGAVRPGSIVTVADPSRRGGAYTHRVVRLTTVAGLPHYVTKGDANPSEDHPPVAPAAILGRARLVVPMAGLPGLWWHQGEHLRLLATGLVVWGALVVFLRAVVRLPRPPARRHQAARRSLVRRLSRPRPAPHHRAEPGPLRPLPGLLPRQRTPARHLAPRG